jgi:hypothetical protein
MWAGGAARGKWLGSKSSDERHLPQGPPGTSVMKTGRSRTKPWPVVVPLRDLVPRSDPKGGSAQRTVFGERPPITVSEEKQHVQDVPVERRQKPGHDRDRKRGETT